MTVTTSTKLQFNWTFILFIAFVHIGAMFALLPSNFSWAAVSLFVFLHWVTGGLGITLGFHRLVTHRSFQTPKWLEYFFVFCGALACEGGVIDWVGMHRLHHLHSDQESDPHNSNQGFWWSHMSWMFYHSPATSVVQSSARHGLRWWEIDLTWMTIQLLQGLGLAHQVRVVC